jgi:hypothetical protein
MRRTRSQLVGFTARLSLGYFEWSEIVFVVAGHVPTLYTCVSRMKVLDIESTTQRMHTNVYLNEVVHGFSVLFLRVK